MHHGVARLLNPLQDVIVDFGILSHEFAALECFYKCPLEIRYGFP